MNAELATLEASVTQLVERYRRLQDENIALRRELEIVRGDNKMLTKKIGLTADRLESLLARLPEE